MAERTKATDCNSVTPQVRILSRAPLIGNVIQRDIGVWRSLEARVVRDDEAAGSNPATPTIIFMY